MTTVDHGGLQMAEGMTVAELARAVGMTARNIRAYQSRGLLRPPRIEDRTARYDAAHVARLHLVSSLQREGFTLAAIKRLLDSPDSYSRVVADRRRRYRENASDIIAAVPVAPERVRHFGETVLEDLVRLGLAWYDGDQLLVHTLFVGVGKSLEGVGLSPESQTALFLAAAEHGASIGAQMRAGLDQLLPNQPTASVQDIARVVLQLHASAFEVALAHAAQTAYRSEDGPAGRSQPTHHHGEPTDHVVILPDTARTARTDAMNG